MRILGAPLRGVLVPMGAAVASVLALTWYGMFWIPAQQHYLDESNLRLLRTMSAQIKAKVDNFDQAIDHAIDAFPSNHYNTETLDKYVRAFAPELQIVDPPKNVAAAQKGAEELVWDRAGDPPRIVIRRDEGRNFLYLGYYRPEDGRRVVAKGDIEKVAEKFLATRSQFDAVLLVNKDGHVITQKSPSGIELARVDSLVDDFKTKRTATDIENVHLGRAPFRLYIQPIQLSLNRAEPTVEGDEPARDEPEEWALCGLVRVEHFRADSSAISYTYLLWFIGALALVFIAIPPLKLELLAPRQRLRDIDGVWVAMTTFLGAALLTFCVTDAYVFAVAFRDTTDQQLTGFGDALKNHFANEVAAINEQRKVLDGDAAWKGLKYGEDHDLRHYQPTSSHVTLSATDCNPGDACREKLVSLLPRHLLPYPFFERVVWYDATGQEQIKWTTRNLVTPFINLKDAELPDSDELVRAASSDPGPSGIDVIQSPTTGETVTALWRTLGPKSGSTLRGQWFSLATPLSFRQPVLPPGFRFAVVDMDGLVLYHSDPTRSLKQNFFEETEKNPALRAAALGRYDDLITGDYEGRRNRFRVTPIDAPGATQARQWSLIVFQGTDIPETVNLETLTLALLLFVGYAAILAGVWAGASFLWTGYPPKWFWPNHSHNLVYRKVVVVNLLLLGLSLVWALVLESTVLVAGTVLFAFAGLGTTFWLLTRDRAQEGTSTTAAPRWRESFYLARVSLVLILAVAPAFACFRAAYAFEMKLVIKSGQSGLERDLNARKRLIADEAEHLTFCEGRDCLPFTKDDFTSRRSQLALDIYVAPFFATCRTGIDETFFSSSLPTPDPNRCDRAAGDWRLQRSSLDRLLGAMHRPYNDVAVELAAVIPNTSSAPPTLASDPSAVTAMPGPGYWFELAAAMIVLYGFMRYFAARLFVLELYERPAADVVPPPGAAGAIGNVLLIGPPGCGKTHTLAEDPRFQIVDVRTMALDNRRERARPVAGERDVLTKVAALALGVPVLEHADAPRPQPTRPSQVGKWAEPLLSEGKTPVAIDHFEYGFDDPDFRDQMLSVLEDLIYRQRRVVWIASTPDPWRRVQDQTEPNGHGPSLPDRDRWVRVFKSFRTVNVPFKDDSAFDDPYYQVLWAGCSREEQLALRQLAEEDVVNPNNESVLRSLLQGGLIVRAPIFRIVNEAFRRFILEAQPSSTIAQWEREGVVLSWATIRTTLVTVAVGIVGLLLLTQQQLVEAWVGYIPMLAPAIPTAMKLLGGFQRGDKLNLSST